MPVRFRSVLVAAVLALALTGCEEEIARPPDLQAYYTLWGAFDPLADRQAIRVVPITDTVGLGSPDPLPVTVTSVDLETGAETAWRDSVIAFGDGSVGHVFVAGLQPAYGSRHVFRVLDVGGTETSALVAVPPLVEPIRQTPVVGTGVDYPHLWIDAPRLNRVRATYILETEACEPRTVTRTLKPSAAQPIEFGWRTLLDLDEEAREIISAQEGAPLSVREITLAVEVASEDWRPPGGVFDPEILVEPGTLSNVTNGFGFVGAAYPVTVTWRPTPDELDRTPFRRVGFGCGA
jgi:hypothetical protein